MTFKSSIKNIFKSLTSQIEIPAKKELHEFQPLLKNWKKDGYVVDKAWFVSYRFLVSDSKFVHQVTFNAQSYIVIRSRLSFGKFFLPLIFLGLMDNVFSYPWTKKVQIVLIFGFLFFSYIYLMRKFDEQELFKSHQKIKEEIQSFVLKVN